MLSLLLGALGEAIRVQLVPFQRAVRVWLPPLAKIEPTAHTSLGETAVTERKRVGYPCIPMMRPERSSVHWLPSQCSTRVEYSSPTRRPTAQTLLASTAATPYRSV